LKIVLLWVGKTRNPHLQGLIKDYSKRVGHFCELLIREVPPAKNRDPVRVVSVEGERLLAKVNPSCLLILLDAGGQSYTTEQFAAFLEKHRDCSPKLLTFAIGGPEGFSEAVKGRADQTLSLSPMTFPHEMARSLLLEQIYRAFSILHGSPYHK
jgi:23S rRNA (pseudouridine1915-N3)-methyltransferase